jgi:recombination protein RecT
MERKGVPETRESPAARVDALVKRQREDYRAIEERLKGAAKAITQALPQSSQLVAEQFTRVLLTSIAKQPKLIECQPTSIVQAAFEAAALGLRIDSVLGHAYLVPFRDGQRGVTLAQLMIGYRGYQELAHRSGKIELLAGYAVREHDAYEWDEGAESYLRYRKRVDGPRGELLAAIGMARLIGARYPLVQSLTREEVYKRRDVSKGYQSALRYKNDDNPWIQWPDEMWAKTAIRHIAKQVPMSPEMQHVAAREEARERGEHVHLVPDSEFESAQIVEATAQELLGDGEVQSG